MATKKKQPEKITIVVADRGWVFVGRAREATQLGIAGIHISDARCVRRWGTTRGLAQLAAEGPQEATKLDDKRGVFVPASDVKAIFECVGEKWGSL